MATMGDVYMRAALFAYECGNYRLSEAICLRIIDSSGTIPTTKDDVTIYWWAAQFASDHGDTRLEEALMEEADTMTTAWNLAVVASVIRLHSEPHIRTLKRRARRARAKARILRGLTTNVPEIPAEDLCAAGL